MRLINVHTFLQEEFFGNDIPRYAILSHRWGQGEVSYQDWQDLRVASRKAGFAKIDGACRQARAHGLEWLWADTNCINKESSAELTEAINSMFQWYAKSEICYAYLVDVVTFNEARWEELLPKFRESSWFTRGWTLQELLAPREVTFYAADWSKIGSKQRSLATDISSVTGIGRAILTGDVSLKTTSIAMRMSWVAHRLTTRVEDMAYCMLGLFDINMPLLYGEGTKAFTRLQEEIIKISNDHTIFCWTWTSSVPRDWVSLLAPSPATFAETGGFTRNDKSSMKSVFKGISIYNMTNAGLSITLPVIGMRANYLLALNAAADLTTRFAKTGAPCIPVAGTRRDGVLYLRRIPFPPRPVIINLWSFKNLFPEALFVMASRNSAKVSSVTLEGLGMLGTRPTYGMLPLIDSINYENAGSEDMVKDIVDLPPLERYQSAGIGCSFFTLRYASQRRLETGEVSGPRLVTSALVFVAVRVSEGATEWFCQVFSEHDYSPFPPGGMRVTQDLKRQVFEASFEQTAHYNKELGLSAVVGNEIHPFGPYRHIQVLHILKGPVLHRSSSRSESDRRQGSKEENEISDRHRNTADVQERSRSIRQAPKEGQFELRFFSTDLE